MYLIAVKFCIEWTKVFKNMLLSIYRDLVFMLCTALAGSVQNPVKVSVDESFTAPLR
jgi:hypothetical protein